MNLHPKMKIKKIVIFAGGETAGPIMPLLAIAKAWQERDSSITPVFFDRKVSVAAHLVPQRGFQFKTMTAGKLRRYWSFRNLLSPILILIGIIRSLILLSQLKPILVMGAGGYVQVPTIIAAWILRIPRIIHQQDVVPTFSNKVVALIANRVTTVFEKSVKDFSQGTGLEKNFAQTNKIFWTGSPCEWDKQYLQTAEARAEAIKLFKLDSDWPTVLVVGGGSGAKGLNQVVMHNLPELLKSVQVIHATGAGKQVKPPINLPEVHDRYHQYEFINRIDLAYSIADIVIARAGIGHITDLAFLSKVSIIVPMPNSHQEANAHFLYDNQAAVVIDQMDITQEMLGKIVRKILFDAKLQQTLRKNISQTIPTDSIERMFKVINSLVQ